MLKQRVVIFLFQRNSESRKPANFENILEITHYYALNSLRQKFFYIMFSSDLTWRSNKCKRNLSHEKCFAVLFRNSFRNYEANTNVFAFDHVLKTLSIRESVFREIIRLFPKKETFRSGSLREISQVASTQSLSLEL